MKNETIKFIKKTVPEELFDVLNYQRKNVKNLKLFKKDKKNYLKNYSKVRTTDKEQLKAQILFYSHALEKGLSHKVIRLGFGVKVIKSLLHYMNVYSNLGYDLEDKVYLNAESIIKEYMILHKEKGFDINFIPENCRQIVSKCQFSCSNSGGTKEFVSKEQKNRVYMNFEELSASRHSVREYADTKLDLSLVKHAIKIATKAPSVCNRQSSRVYVITNEQIIKEALDIQCGFRGYKLPPCLILVTSDTRFFIDITERNQSYVDGGIFSMSLLYALEYSNLATCALNTMFDNKRERQTRQLLSVPEYENLVMYISVGNFLETYKVPKSFRLSEKEITQYID